MRSLLPELQLELQRSLLIITSKFRVYINYAFPSLLHTFLGSSQPSRFPNKKGDFYVKIIAREKEKTNGGNGSNGQ
jgi:hypothetical protein